MVGYSQVAKAYRLFDKDSQKIIKRRDVIFDESTSDNKNDEQFTFSVQEQQQVMDSVENRPVVKSENTFIEESDSDGTDDFVGFETAGEDDSETENHVQKETSSSRGRPKIIRTVKPGRPRKQQGLNNMVKYKIPTTVKEAICGANKNAWYEAMLLEMNSLKKNNTWSLADLPEGANAINSKWVYAIKRNEFGEVDRFKARLVPKGCSQKYGVNYNETFSPVVRYSTIRLVIALAVNWKMHLHQIDISSAYLNSDIHHDIYMRQPELFVDNKYPNKVLKLHQAIYGLKQSGKEWYDKLNEVLKEIGFEQSKLNHVYIYQAVGDCCSICRRPFGWI